MSAATVDATANKPAFAPARCHMVELAGQMLKARQHEAAAGDHAREIAVRRCVVPDRQVDAPGGELHGLTETETAPAEGAA